MTSVASGVDPLPPLREVIAAHGLGARKSLGQNFIFDLNLTRRIARTAGSLHDHDVLEVGPGPGGLTRALLMEGARRVVVIERDNRCLGVLDEISAAYPGRLKIISGDALTIDPVEHLTPPIRVVANLPYNISTALLTRWLRTDWPPFWASLTLMFQREVAQRIVADPGSKAYGRLSVLAGWRTEAQLMFDVSPKAFIPQPKVTSAIVHLLPRTRALAEAELPDLEAVTAATFGQRRKMLRQSLKSLFREPEAVCRKADIDPRARPEALPVEAFCALALALAR